jgi:DnaJ-class molecular chaperone
MGKKLINLSGKNLKPTEMECSICDGTGLVDGKTCSLCHGVGSISSTKMKRKKNER